MTNYFLQDRKPPQFPKDERNYGISDWQNTMPGATCVIVNAKVASLVTSWSHQFSAVQLSRVPLRAIAVPVACIGSPLCRDSQTVRRLSVSKSASVCRCFSPFNLDTVGM